MKTFVLICYWFLPIFCLITSIAGFCGQLSADYDRSLSCGILFAIITPLICWANIAAYRTGYFDD